MGITWGATVLKRQGVQTNEGWSNLHAVHVCMGHKRQGPGTSWANAPGTSRHIQAHLGQMLHAGPCASSMPAREERWQCWRGTRTQWAAWPCHPTAPRCAPPLVSASARLSPKPTHRLHAHRTACAPIAPLARPTQPIRFGANVALEHSLCLARRNTRAAFHIASPCASHRAHCRPSPSLPLSH